MLRTNPIRRTIKNRSEMPLPIKRVSAKKARELRAWRKIVAECGDERGWVCEVRDCFAAWTEGHHKLKRSQGGKNTKENCLLVCRASHETIERNPDWAVKNGYSIGRRSGGQQT